MITMRDGTSLYTLVYEPVTAVEPLPFMMMRTPYGVEGRFKRYIDGLFKKMAEDGYIFVLQDIRGRYESEGQFVMMRPIRDRKQAEAIDECTDTFDTIEWLLNNIPDNNGRVGMTGVSYPGWLTAMALLDPHPALKAASPQAPPADMFLGDDFHHNGAFRLSYGFEYVTRMETTKKNFIFQFDMYDTYEWYLDLGALSNVDRIHLHGSLPTWNDFTAHPNYDEFWQRQAFTTVLDKVTVPTLNVAGWWDQEDFYGPLKVYDLFEKRDPDNLNRLVVGPWNHGGWSSGYGDGLGKIKFDSPAGWYFREYIEAPWFAFHLKDGENPNIPEAYTFRTGANKWISHNAWPPKDNVTVKNLYFHPDRKLSFRKPEDTGDSSFDSYLSDPTNPVPYRKRPIEPTYYSKGSGWGIWQTEDQRFVDHRSDVLSWET
ncbi:MAG: CocE/NonD family hydrolase, partial [Candidatus Latescibacteria bacterium]|nr:CocE/NonD family hydrolase [Candidatus Latescibacterota bacterium]